MVTALLQPEDSIVCLPLQHCLTRRAYPEENPSLVLLIIFIIVIPLRPVTFRHRSFADPSTPSLFRVERSDHMRSQLPALVNPCLRLRNELARIRATAVHLRYPEDTLIRFAIHPVEDMRVRSSPATLPIRIARTLAPPSMRHIDAIHPPPTRTRRRIRLHRRLHLRAGPPDDHTSDIVPVQNTYSF